MLKRKSCTSAISSLAEVSVEEIPKATLLCGRVGSSVVLEHLAVSYQEA
jgi:hypothetical protein